MWVQTYRPRRASTGAMRPEDVVRLKAQERENARLKRIVGDQALDIDMLRWLGELLSPERRRRAGRSA